MDYRFSTVEPMLKIIRNHKSGMDVKGALETLLDHDDYQIQFDFFNRHPAGIGFSKRDFMEMFLNIETYESNDEISMALKMRVDDIRHVFNNLEVYESSLGQLKAMTEDDFEMALARTNRGLLTPIDLKGVQVVIAIGIGVSGAFNQGDINFLDYVKSFSQMTKQGFLNTLSHELHHLGYKEQFNRDVSKYRPTDAFLHYFSGEGLAVKFGNNFEGVLTKKNFEGEHTYRDISYGYYMDNKETIHEQFFNDLKGLERVGTHDFADYLFHERYWNRDVYIDGELKKIYLKNPVAYYLGADIWGLLHDQLDRKDFFNLLSEPDGLCECFLQCFDIYNKNN